MMRRSLKHTHGRRPHRVAAATVEFAIVAPILFLFIVLPMFEFGRALMVLDLVTNAARAGARVGVLPGNSNTSVTSVISTTLTNQGISGETTTITVNGTSADVSTANSGDSINVAVSIPYSKISWVTGEYLTNATLTANQTLRHE